MNFSKQLFLLTLTLAPVSAPLIATNPFSPSRQAFTNGLLSKRNIFPGIVAGSLTLPAFCGTRFIPEHFSPGYHLWARLAIPTAIAITALDQSLESSENTNTDNTAHKTAHCLGRTVGTGAVAATTLVAIAVALNKLLGK